MPARSSRVQPATPPEASPIRLRLRSTPTPRPGSSILQLNLTLLSSTGQPLSGATDTRRPSLAFSVCVAIDANHNAWVGNTDGDHRHQSLSRRQPVHQYACCNWAGGIAIDQRGYVWVANYIGNSVSQLASDGTVISSGYSDSKAASRIPRASQSTDRAMSGSRTILGSSITELAGSAASSPGQILSPTAGYAPMRVSSRAGPSPSTPAATSGSPTTAPTP